MPAATSPCSCRTSNGGVERSPDSTSVGDERVLDAGCGPGRDTLLLLARLPSGRVVAVDGSLAMLERLRHTVGARMGQVEPVHADLGRPLPITEPVDAVTRAIDAVTGAAEHWEFPGVEPTRERLGAAGFVDLDVRLRPAPFIMAGRAAHQYLRTVVLGGYLDDLPAPDHDAFVQAVLAALPEPVIDYVRLEITATRSG